MLLPVIDIYIRNISNKLMGSTDEDLCIPIGECYATIEKDLSAKQIFTESGKCFY